MLHLQVNLNRMKTCDEKLETKENEIKEKDQYSV
jgi:hypothetical protein